MEMMESHCRPSSLEGRVKSGKAAWRRRASIVSGHGPRDELPSGEVKVMTASGIRCFTFRISIGIEASRERPFLARSG